MRRRRFDVCLGAMCNSLLIVHSQEPPLVSRTARRNTRTLVPVAEAHARNLPRSRRAPARRAARRRRLCTCLGSSGVARCYRSPPVYLNFLSRGWLWSRYISSEPLGSNRLNWLCDCRGKPAIPRVPSTITADGRRTPWRRAGGGAPRQRPGRSGRCAVRRLPHQSPRRGCVLRAQFPNTRNSFLRTAVTYVVRRYLIQ
jgi:hypothetical protein